MVFALLLSAIAWNLGTWCLGLPASSSHTLIGSIMGVGLANSLMHGGIYAFGAGVNWEKAKEVGMALLISPLVGFTCAALLLLSPRRSSRAPHYTKPPKARLPRQLGFAGFSFSPVRVSVFAHGSNDGQKGMGLIVLILVGILPGIYALKMDGILGKGCSPGRHGCLKFERHLFTLKPAKRSPPPQRIHESHFGLS